MMQKQLAIIVFSFLFFFASLGIYSYIDQEIIAEKVTEAKVIEIYKDKIKIQTDDGRRIFVINFGDIEISDFYYGEEILVVLDHRQYRVVGVAEKL